MPREQVFITTKFLPLRRDPVAQLERSLRRLGVEQIDLYGSRTVGLSTCGA